MLGSYPQSQPQPGVGGLQGSCISLISKSDIRYEGFLYSINPDENTVALRNVKMLGTEGRKNGPQIPKGDQLYEFIIFRGSDIKDLTVFDANQRPTESSHPPDPAILNAWTAKSSRGNNNNWSKPQNQSWGNNNNNRGYQQNRNWDNQYNNNNNRGGRQPQRYERKDDRHDNRNYDRRDNRGYDRNYRQDDRRQGRDDRGQNQRGRSGNDGGRSRGYSGGAGSGGYNKRRNNSNKHTGKNFLVSKDKKEKEFTEDFNFEENNKKLDLDKVANEFKEKAQAAQTTEDNKVKAQFSITTSGYDKTKSFFDEISCEALERKIAGSEPKRLDRETREQQKQLDQETFGTSNLADAGGYGYGPRRGGFRGRRSGGGQRNYGGRY